MFKYFSSISSGDISAREQLFIYCGSQERDRERELMAVVKRNSWIRCDGVKENKIVSRSVRYLRADAFRHPYKGGSKDLPVAACERYRRRKQGSLPGYRGQRDRANSAREVSFLRVDRREWDPEGSAKLIVANLSLTRTIAACYAE